MIITNKDTDISPSSFSKASITDSNLWYPAWLYTVSDVKMMSYLKHISIIIQPHIDNDITEVNYSTLTLQLSSFESTQNIRPLPDKHGL